MTLAVLNSSFTHNGNIALFLSNEEIAYFSSDLQEHLSSDDNHWWTPEPGNDLEIREVPSCYDAERLYEQEELEEEEYDLLAEFPEVAHVDMDGLNAKAQAFGLEVSILHVNRMDGNYMLSSPSLYNVSVYNNGEWAFGNVHELRSYLQVGKFVRTEYGTDKFYHINVKLMPTSDMDGKEFYDRIKAFEASLS